MAKKIGFIVLILGLMVALRPSLFKNMLGLSTEEKSKDIVTDSNRSSNPDAEFTAYADGYSEDDFGEAFSSTDEMFPLNPDGTLQSPGGLWDVFLKLKFDIQYDEAIDDVVFKPQFTKDITDLEGKQIEIKGYIVPSDVVATAMGESNGDGSMFMLSAYPASSCFFCGGGGPESVMEVYPKKPIPYTKEVVKLKGTLELNQTDYLRMAYILKNVTWVEE
ncbi:MAG: hypothetical protein GY810_29690 [Aureispira sp.]|nr:hypothetical protein [Aureispira sp.]